MSSQAFLAAGPSITSPWHGMRRSKSQLATSFDCSLNTLVFLLSSLETICLCQKVPGCIAPVKKKADDLVDVLEYCSLGGRLKRRSASIRVLVGAW